MRQAVFTYKKVHIFAGRHAIPIRADRDSRLRTVGAFTKKIEVCFHYGDENFVKNGHCNGK